MLYHTRCFGVVFVLFDSGLEASTLGPLSDLGASPTSHDDVVRLSVDADTFDLLAPPVGHAAFQAQRPGQIRLQRVQVAGGLADPGDMFGATALGVGVDGELVAGPGSADGVWKGWVC
jgi:hypothetical protein